MHKKFKYLLPVLFGLIIISVIQSCRKDPVLPADKLLEEQAADAVYDLMQEFYLWYDSMPVINVDDYHTPEEMMKALRYEPRDRWSYVSSMEDYYSYFVEGSYKGHGFSYGVDNEGNYRILFVYEDSDLYKKGVIRGWRIIKINGSVVVENSNLSDLFTEGTDTFVFLDHEGKEVSVSSTKKEIKINSVLYSDTLRVNGELVGHIVFNSFIDPAKAELDTAFGFLNKMKVEKLILDMGYNRGGSMDVAVKLASLIAGSTNAGKTFVKYSYNEKHKNDNREELLVDEAFSLDIGQLIVFTSGSTASASEAVINGLDPYMDIKTIGSPSYGKPVGMNVWSYADKWVFVPLTFSIQNSLDNGNYFNGLPVDSYITDQAFYEFSDGDEPYLKEAVHYLTTGTFTGYETHMKALIPRTNEEEFGLEWIIGSK